jgi:GAF domain-containing protein/anti-sigma regulatory factor (Ser/Thr protein kinase)
MGELALTGQPDAVPRARAFATATVRAAGHAELAADVELIVAELVTNAMLHARPPVVVRVRAVEGGVRVEVHDAVRAAPVRVNASTATMTGRGLALVEALVSRWGVEPEGAGKMIWCELLAEDAQRTDHLVPAEPLDLDRFLASWDDEEQEARYTVQIGDLPTDLLVEAKAHIDNLVREFALAVGGAESGSTSAVPTRLAQLIETVVHRFAEARDAIKRQAVAAAGRGESRTSLTLTLPVSAADAGEQYLAALDEVDTYAHASRLLTLETPPQHSVFRRWYVESMVTQLRAVAAGLPRPATPTFEQRLLDEVAVLTSERWLYQRAARLQKVTASLARTGTVDEVARAAVMHCLPVLGASAAALALVRDGEVDLRAATGYDERVLRAVASLSEASSLPDGEVLRSREPVWVESRLDRREAFPGLHRLEPTTAALAVVPLKIGDALIGLLRVSFDAPRLFDEDERELVQALAMQTAQALARSASSVAEREARAAAEHSRWSAQALAGRLTRLQRLTDELVRAQDDSEVAAIVVDHAADALGADRAMLHFLGRDRTKLVLVRARGLSARESEQWHAIPLDADLPSCTAVREAAPMVASSRAELETRFPQLAGHVESDFPLICVPLHADGRPLGVLALTFPGDHTLRDDEITFITSIANACAQALERIRAVRASSALAARLGFLEQASTALAESLDYRETLTAIARLVVPRLSDWCAIDVVEDDVLHTVAMAHADARKLKFAEELKARYPRRPDLLGGADEVVRTGRPHLVEHVTDEMLAAAAVDDQHLELTRQLGLRSAVIVPLTGRSGTYGALTMFHAESARRYDDDDLQFALEIARRAARAVENARDYQDQSGRLAVIQRVAEAAQHAILPPVPEAVGPLRLTTAYVSAAQDALIGGDLYEVAQYDGAVRLLVGDVRGKGLDAVRLATVVLGEFRAVASDYADLEAVAERMDARLRQYLTDEDFVTAVLVEVQADGSTTVLSCGHPPPLLASAGTISEVPCTSGVPLGLGAAPAPTRLRLGSRDRMLLYTDGLIEARDSAGAFADLATVVAPLADGSLNAVPERILAALRAEVGGSLADDLALVALEYAGVPSPRPPAARVGLSGAAPTA